MATAPGSPPAPTPAGPGPSSPPPPEQEPPLPEQEPEPQQQRRGGIARRAAAAASAIAQPITSFASAASARVRPWLDAAGDALAEAYPGLADALAEAYPALADETPATPVEAAERGSVSVGVVRWAVDASGWQPEGGSDGPEFRFLCSLIAERDELQAVERRRRWEDKRAALLSRLCARRVCCAALGMAHEDVQIRRTKGRKPFLANPPPASAAQCPNFNFNVSHAGDYVVLAAEPYCVCGVDIAVRAEHEGRSTAEYLDGFAAQFTESEWERIRAAGCPAAQEEAFHGLWACKEAFVKARGDGLGFDVRRSEFRRRARGGVAVVVDGCELPRWRLHVQRLGRASFVATARGPPEDIVDAYGTFRRTLRRRRFTEAEWAACLDSPVPAFEEVPVSFLVPDARRREYLRLAGGASPAALSAAPSSGAEPPQLQFRVAWARVRVRSAPGQHGRHVTWRLRGEVVTIAEQVGGWVRLHTPDGDEEQWMPLDGAGMGMGRLLEPIGLARELLGGSGSLEDLAALAAQPAHGAAQVQAELRQRWAAHLASQGGPVAELAPTARIWVVSDLFLGELDNRRWLLRLAAETPHDADGVPWAEGALIVAGNVATEMGQLRAALSSMRGAFQHVFFCCGNLELWGGRPDSIAKFFAVMQLCAELGVRTTPALLGDAVAVLPIQCWYKSGFGEPGEALNAGCRWPEGLGAQPSDEGLGDTICDFFLSLNDLDSFRERCPAPADVVSFSHFLPREALCGDEDRAAGRCAGASELDALVRGAGSTVHVCGHTLLGCDVTTDGLRYVANAIGPPHSRWMGPAAPKVVWSAP
eukprot:TRINITY_DN69963_c0_g1_i1.p1 TRINITY_DN69963_c0_g1~~TRINITY_DN69963_c0_g1_i1.p1  ORF type:complete len:854 (+),score=211.35 TRINITY_DN69963_c0_g1_i1:114-2564(+)